MATTPIHYDHDNTRMHGYIAYPSDESAKPGILIAHDWTGCNDFAREKAEYLASLGYVAMAIDMYGEGRQGESTEEKMALMGPVIEDRQMLQSRINAALTTLQADARVDAKNIGAIGFCFGGLCVLDLARSGADVKGVVSFHGLLNRPEHSNATIKAKVLALHGHDDPMVPPEQVLAFQTEMNEANVDWQMHIYGRTQHAFSNPKANDASMGTVYNATAEKRALAAMRHFFAEVFTN